MLLISEGNLNLLFACTYSELCKGEGIEVKRKTKGGEAEMLRIADFIIMTCVSGNDIISQTHCRLSSYFLCTVVCVDLAKLGHTKPKPQNQLGIHRHTIATS